MELHIRRAMGVVAAVTMLAGCGGSPYGAAPQSVLPSAGRARVMPGSSGDLIYVTTTKGVVVLSYPELKIVGSLPAAYEYSGVCSDPNNGNVYIAESSDVFVYAHGGTTPIARLTPPPGYDDLTGCSVDRNTDNLAVVSMGGVGHGALLIYAGGQGSATALRDANLVSYRYPAYDYNGDLYFTCLTTRGEFHIDEIPAGHNRFVQLKIPPGFSIVKLQWVGTYLTFEQYTGNGSTVYQLQIKGEVGTVVGSEQFYNAGYPSNFWQYGNGFINALGQVKPGGEKGIGLWTYPTGGIPTRKRFGVTKGKQGTITDMTVSVEPSE